MRLRIAEVSVRRPSDGSQAKDHIWQLTAHCDGTESTRREIEELKRAGLRGGGRVDGRRQLIGASFACALKWSRAQVSQCCGRGPRTWPAVADLTDLTNGPFSLSFLQNTPVGHSPLSRH